MCALILSASTDIHAQKKGKKKKNKKNKGTMELTEEIDSVSYSIGINIGQQLKGQGMTSLNTEAIAAALGDVLAGNDLKISEADAQTLLQNYFTNQKEKANEAAKKEGEDFLAANAKKEGITVTESGLQYEVITQGTGEKPTAASTVKTHYHGMLIDGTVFDSSVDRGEPISFPLNRVIAGWTEGLQLMPVGSKYRFYIPYNLAYGANGSAPKIPGYAALIFDVELIAIEK